MKPHILSYGHRDHILLETYQLADLSPMFMIAFWENFSRLFKSHVILNSIPGILNTWGITTPDKLLQALNGQIAMPPQDQSMLLHPIFSYGMKQAQLNWLREANVSVVGTWANPTQTSLLSPSFIADDLHINGIANTNVYPSTVITKASGAKTFVNTGAYTLDGSYLDDTTSERYYDSIDGFKFYEGDTSGLTSQVVLPANTNISISSNPWSHFVANLGSTNMYNSFIAALTRFKWMQPSMRSRSTFRYKRLSSSVSTYFMTAVWYEYSPFQQLSLQNDLISRLALEVEQGRVMPNQTYSRNGISNESLMQGGLAHPLLINDLIKSSKCYIYPDCEVTTDDMINEQLIPLTSSWLGELYHISSAFNTTIPNISPWARSTVTPSYVSPMNLQPFQVRFHVTAEMADRIANVDRGVITPPLAPVPISTSQPMSLNMQSNASYSYMTVPFSFTPETSSALRFNSGDYIVTRQWKQQRNIYSGIVNNSVNSLTAAHMAIYFNNIYSSPFYAFIASQGYHHISAYYLI